MILRRLRHLLLVLLTAAPAAAQTRPPDVALPDFTPATPETPSQQSEIDIASAVISAAKGATTVQEAPSIITIITADEIRERGFRNIGQILNTIPGWIHIEAEGNQVETQLVRGTPQSVLYLRDGVSLFEPVFNIPSLTRVLPLESVKRIEVVTGPGGVLWGANSFLGVLNVITKDAEDVNGAEFSAGYGTGPGDPNSFRAYGMFGKAFFRNKLKVFLHASFESFVGPQYRRPALLATSPSPQPPGTLLYGLQTVQTANDRSWIVNLDGKISLGPVSLYFQVPFGTIHHSVGFASVGITRDFIPGSTPAQVDPLSTQNPWNWYDRYAFLEYRDRFAGGRLGISAKGFYINFNRDLSPRVFPSSAALPGGLSFQVRDFNIQRFGATFDLDYSGPFRWNRVLAGAEAFNESTSQAQTYFLSPDARRLPIVCPLADPNTYQTGCPIPFIYATERTVVGVFLADQIRPTSKLTIDGGLRYQQGFGRASYRAQVLGQASLVWQFYPNYHIKLNWSQGFRPPVFNNTYANGAAVAFAGNPRLQVEQSSAYQGEINARVLRNTRNIRELQLRIDYSYTLLNNFIVVTNSAYQNAGRRALHSVEFLGKLYLTGDHAITLGYTFLSGNSSDRGKLRYFPNHWFSLGAVFHVVKERLEVNTTLNIYGAHEDPNRVSTNVFILPGGQQTTSAGFGDLTIDRLPPVAVLQIGARAQIWKRHLSASVQLYNLLNQRYFYPDAFYDFAPTLEPQPNPAPGFSMFASLIYRP